MTHAFCFIAGMFSGVCLMLAASYFVYRIAERVRDGQHPRK